MKPSTGRRKKLSTKVMTVAGVSLVVAGLVSAILKASARRRAKLAARPAAKEDLEAEARMEGEGGSMQPVAVS